MDRSGATSLGSSRKMVYPAMEEVSAIMMGAFWTERLCHTGVFVGVDQGRLLIGKRFSDAWRLDVGGDVEKLNSWVGTWGRKKGFHDRVHLLVTSTYRWETVIGLHG